MRPERFLGTDPAPGDLSSVDRVGGSLRAVVLALAEARLKVEAIVGPQSIWQGPIARPIVTTLTEFAARLRAVEDAVVDFAQAVETWRTGLVGRQQRRAELTETISQLAGRPDAEAERQRILVEVQQMVTEHTVGGTALISAADSLAEVLAEVDDDSDLAVDLDRGLTAVTVAVDEWIAESAAELLATAESLSETAGLTTVVSQILGVVGDEAPDEAENVRRLASVSAGAHRLRLALRRSWASLAPDELPAASFAAGGQTPAAISDRLRGDTSESDHGGDAR